jgi:hypothetical protein
VESLDRGGGAIGGAAIRENEVSEPGFGSIRAVLSAVCINYRVGFRLYSPDSFLTNSPVGDRRHQEQGRRSPLPGRRIGRVLRFVSE